MSEYMSLYARKDDTFVPLYSESRSNIMFQLLAPFSTFEKVKPLTPRIMRECADRLANEIARLQQNIYHLNDKINMVRSLNNSLEEKMAAYDELVNQSNEITETLNELIRYQERFNFIDSMVNIYFGLETGDNITLDIVEEN